MEGLAKASKLWHEYYTDNRHPDLDGLLDFLADRVIELEDWQVKALDWLYDDRAATIEAIKIWEGRTREAEYREQLQELESLISRAESRR